MELGGLEPPTSWVRLQPVQFAKDGFALVQPNQILSVWPDLLIPVARSVARLSRLAD